MLNVFLASPGDVDSERELAEEVVNEVNRAVRNLGCYVVLRKWEDISPGYGRPQSRINPILDQCDIFVGLLWERWGEPSGEYSSGFEEEFERAVASCKAGSKPEIWLFFKHIDPAKLQDPGDQLRSVVAFRNQQRASKQLFFKEIRDGEEWKTEFRTSLLDYVIGQALPNRAIEHQPASSVPAFESPDISAMESALPATDSPNGSKQLRALSALLSQTFQANTFEFSSTETSPLEEFEVARLFLLSATLMFHRYTSEALGTHEINLLYKHRERLKATATEQLQLLRATVGDQSDVKPGWFWFQDMDEESLINSLLTLATQDSSDEVRIGALDLLASAKIKIPPKLWPALPLDHKSFSVRESALSYLGAVGDLDTLSFLDGLALDDDSLTSTGIQAARLQILSRLDPDNALSEVIAKGGYLSAEELRALPMRISDVGEQTLVRGTGSQWEQIRELCLEELGRRGSLTAEFANKFTTDPSLTVRAISFQRLAKLGALPDLDIVRKALAVTDEDSAQNVGKVVALSRLLGRRKVETSPDVDSIITDYFKTWSTEKLLNRVDWYSGEGRLAYAALAQDRFNAVAASLRSDLTDGFERVREESLRRNEQEFGAQIRSRLVEAWKDLNEFVKSQFERIVLLTLAGHPDPGDAALARPYLERADNLLREPAVTIICKVGSSEDVSALLRIVNEAYGEVVAEAAAGALSLSSRPIDVARDLLFGNSSDARKIALQWMYAHDSSEVREIFAQLVSGENSTQRVRAVYHFSKQMSAPELETLLEQYISNGAYYYNVIAWLDRLLYSPAPLRTMFVKDLEKKAN